jgi:methyl-accepting chemotaxis protein
MDAVSAILAALALFVGFCGLWLASYALRKIDTQITEFLQGPIQRMREQVAELRNTIGSTERELDTFKRQTKDALTNMIREAEQSRSNLAQTNRAVSDLADRVQNIAAAQQAAAPKSAPNRLPPRDAAE